VLRESLAVQSLMLGMNPEARYDPIAFTLSPGDLLFLSSDGIFEAPCANGRQFGVEGVEEFFACYTGDAPLEALLADVRRRSTFHPLGDDVSAILMSPE